MKNAIFFERLFFMGPAEVFHRIFVASHSVNKSKGRSSLKFASFQHSNRYLKTNTQKGRSDSQHAQFTVTKPLTFNAVYRQGSFKLSTKLLLLIFIISIAKSFSQQIPLDIAVQNRYNEITLNA